ncbi:MAG TPA: hypothetical protein VK206_23360 [Anaerolineales bacterium]|nr:hypothetical protein [Anaerolineales bacterium]HLO31319.1 hypothetical protein [Anaerolineales bacterium]
MPFILFVCTANQFRSPLAAACLLQGIKNENFDTKWIVESAGTWTIPGMPAATSALQIAKQLKLAGLDRHLTRQVDQQLLDQFDLIIVMETSHKEAISSEFPSIYKRVYLLSELVDDFPYDIPDPMDPGIDPGDVGRDLYRMLARGKEKILQLAMTLSGLQSSKEFH